MALALDNAQAGIVRATALTLLRNFARPSHLDRLKAALSDPDPLVRAKALEAMEGFPPETRWRLANTLLNDPVRLVRFEAARTLAPVPNSLLSPEQISILDRAVDDYIGAQRVNEDMAPYHINIGVAHLQRGHPDKAEVAYRDAIRIDPTFSPAYANLADLYRERTLDDEGEAILREGLAVSPKSADLHHALGLLQARKRRYPEAIAELGKASSLDPDNPRYAYVYAVALSSAGKPGPALRVLKEAYRSRPYDREVLLGLASILRDQERTKEATKYAEELVAVMPENAEAKRFLEEIRAKGQSPVGELPLAEETAEEGSLPGQGNHRPSRKNLEPWRKTR
jgi:Flp pilus assembly protein TadD